MDEETPLTAEDSAYLVRSCQVGDEEAREVLFSRYFERVEALVRARAGPRLRELDRVDDIIQETFLAAVEAFDRFEIREEAGLINWLAKIAERKIANAAKHDLAQRRDRRREVQLFLHASSGSSFAAGLVDSATGVPEKVGRRELAVRVEECLQELDQHQREVVLLRHFAGGSWEFIAGEMGLPSADAARKLFGRARSLLASMMS